MAKYRVYGKVSGTKYLGVFEADSPEEAEDKALNSDSNTLDTPQGLEFDLDDSSCSEAIVELVE